MAPSEVHVSYKKRGNIEVTSASTACYTAARETPLAPLVTEKYIAATCTREGARTLSLSLPRARTRVGLEMSFAVLTAILTAARERGIAAILRRTDDTGQTTHRINKSLIYRVGPF